MTGEMFSEWIELQLDQRGWKASDLAREARIDQGTLSNVLNGARGAGLTFCTRVAEALSLPPEMVLRRAGLLPDAPETTAAMQEMVHLFAGLSPDDQTRVIAIVRALLRTSTEGEPGSEALATATGGPAGLTRRTADEGAVAYGEPARAVGIYRLRRNPTMRALMIALGVLIVVTVIAIAALALLQGSWWYPVATDRPLDADGRARIVAMRDRLVERTDAGHAVVWLDLGLAPGTHPSDVRAYLIAARDELTSLDEPSMASTIAELDALIEMIRPPSAAPALWRSPVPTVNSAAAEP